MPKKLDVSKKVTGLRRQAEELLQTTTRDVVAIPVKDVQRLVHELQTYQIELKIQNDELRRTQMEIEAARGSYVDLYDFSPAGILALDTFGTIMEANVSAGTLLGVNRKKLIGQSLVHFVASEDRDLFHRHGQEVLRTGARHTCELRLRREGGASSCVHIESRAGREEPGHITHWRMALLDISERKQAEEQLRNVQDELEQRVRDRTAELRQANQTLQGTTTHLHTLLEQFPLAIIELDVTGRITRWNDTATQMFGWTEQEVLGREPPFESPGEGEAVDRIGVSIMQRQAVQNTELRRLKKDGTPVDLSFWSATLRDSNGNPIGSIGLFIDITEHKRLEAQFRQAKKMEAVGRLAGGVAHDFNNLLTVINGYSALLLAQMSPEDPRQEMATEILRAGERAASLTKQLLTFSRKQTLMPQPLNLNHSMQSISSGLRRLLGDNITLTMTLASDLWSIHGDPEQLDQVAMSLASNARDAMPNGGGLTIATRNITVTSERPDRHGIMPPGDYVQVSVCDNGRGMSTETLSHLFEPFFTTKDVGQSKGLGLAMVYGIVKQSQGYIFADSVLGQGTTVHLYFPRLMAPTAHRTTGSETVLLVEDLSSVRAVVVHALKARGYRVIEVGSGEDALRVADALPEPVDALVTDVMMPQMSGPVLAEQLRQVWPGLRVLFMSGFTYSLTPTFLQAPGTAFIQKPFLPDDLARQLRDLLDKSI